MATSSNESTNPFRDPLYLSPNDFPGAPLSMIKLKNETHYDVWSRQVLNNLKGKNKMGFVDSSFPKPTGDSIKAEQWDQCHSAIISWFEKSVDPEVVSLVSRTGNAVVIWDTLKLRFGKTTATQRYNLRHKPYETKQTRRFVRDYHNSISETWSEIDIHEPPILCTCGACTCKVNERLEEKTKQIRLMEFLLGLTDSFKPLRTTILAKDTLPTVDTAYNLTKEDEDQLYKADGSMATVDRLALAFNRAVGNLNLPMGEIDTNGRTQNKQGGKGKMVCSYCHKLGHTKEQCYKLVGYPPGWNRNQGRNRQPGQGGPVQAFQAMVEGHGAQLGQWPGGVNDTGQLGPNQHVHPQDMNTAPGSFGVGPSNVASFQHSWMGQPVYGSGQSGQPIENSVAPTQQNSIGNNGSFVGLAAHPTGGFMGLQHSRASGGTTVQGGLTAEQFQKLLEVLNNVGGSEPGSIPGASTWAGPFD